MGKIKTENLITAENSRDELLIANVEAYSAVLSKIETLAINTWIGNFNALVLEYQTIDRACTDALQAQLDGEFNFTTLLEQIELIIPRYTELVSHLPDIEDTYSPQTILDAWAESHQSAVTKISKRFTVIMPRRVLQKSVNDSSLRATWKASLRLSLKAWEVTTSSQNWVRRLFKCKEHSKPRFKRKVRYSSYLDSIYKLPIQQHIVDTWGGVMVEIAEMLAILHDDTHQRLLDLMLLEQQQQVLKKKELNQVLQHLKSLKDRSVRFDEIFQRTKALEASIVNQFNTSDLAAKTRVSDSWNYVGTLTYPNLMHHAPRLEYLNKRFNKRTLSTQTRWIGYFHAVREDRLKDLELAMLQTRIPLTLLAGLGVIREQILQQILPAFANPHKVISDALTGFRASQGETQKNLRKDILSQNRSLLRDLRRDLLPRILESILQAKLADRLLNLKSQIKYLIDQLPEEHTIFRGQSAAKGQSKKRFITIELKTLVMSEVFPQLNQAFDEFIQSISNQSDKLSRDVTEIDQIIEFNLGAALDLLADESGQDAKDGAFNVVTEGLERAMKQLSLLIEESQNIQMICRDTIPQISQTADLRIQELVNNERVVDLQIRITRAKLKRRLVNYRQQLVSVIKSILPKIRLRGQNLIQAILLWYRRLRKITGLSIVPADIDKQLHQYLSETASQIEALPFVYQRLFSFEPAADERFFIGREKELQLIQDKFNDFKSGKNSTTALVGESGSGRTSLINMAETKIFSHHAKYRMDLTSTIHTVDELLNILKQNLNQPEAQTIDEIVAALNEKPTKIIVIVENIQNMFLRFPGGFEALNRFLLLMMQTSQNVFWVATCGLYSWSYFDRILNIRTFFHEVITLRELDDETIENVIMKRHRVSGYQLEFETPTHLDKSIRLKRSLSESDRQDVLRKSFFQQLNRLASGNLTVAILFWLKAVREIKSDRFLIAPFIEFDPSFLSQMSSPDLFTFAAFLQHETLTPEHHAKIFHQPEETSVMQISKLERRGILIKKSKGYQIHYLLYRPMVRTLKLHNILH